MMKKSANTEQHGQRVSVNEPELNSSPQTSGKTGGGLIHSPVCRVHVNAYLTQGSPGLTDTNVKVGTFKGELFFLSYFTVCSFVSPSAIKTQYEGAILIVE